MSLNWMDYVLKSLQKCSEQELVCHQSPINLSEDVAVFLQLLIKKYIEILEVCLLFLE